MRKLTRVAGIIFLLAAVCYTGLAQDITVSSINGLGIGANGSGVWDLQKVKQNEEIYTHRILSENGGVILQGIAVASGNAVGLPVTMQYNPARPDGQRLLLTIGAMELTPDIYDWELIPIARFVESDYTACMTLFDEPRTPDERKIHGENKNKGIMWANFHPAFGNSLIGLNLFFVDAMLVNPGLMQFADEAFAAPIPGYHASALNVRNLSRPLRMENTEMVELFLALEGLYGNYNSYIYTDHGTEISYRIENRRIVFSGVPSYRFVYLNHDEKTAAVATEMNERIRSLYRNIHAINPTVFRSAEKTAQWAAFFRMVKAEYPQVWQKFMTQIEGVEPALKAETPRYWLSATERE
jgi:hypothetical protein